MPQPFGTGERWTDPEIARPRARSRRQLRRAGLSSHPSRHSAAAVGLGRELRAIEPEGHGAVVDLPRQSGF